MQINDNSHCADQIKRALAPEADRSRQMATAMLLKGVLAAGGLGLVGGAGLGLGKMLTEEKPYTPDPSYQPVDIAIPPKKKRNMLDQPKIAAETSAIDSLAGKLAPNLPSQGAGGYFFGNTAESPWQVPALLGLGVPLGALALKGGMGIGHDLVDNRRKSDLEAQMKRKQDEYKKTVGDLMASKSAADQEIERELDALAELYEKHAGDATVSAGQGLGTIASGVGDWLGSTLAGVGKGVVDSPLGRIAAGPYSAYALLSALGAGKLSYDYFKKRSPEKIQEQALRQRALERYGGAKPIHLNPMEGGEDFAQ